MADVKLFYGSTSGNTESVAEMIAEALDGIVSSVTNIADASAEDLEEADGLILGIPTYGDGDPQEDWEEFIPNLEEIDLSGKKVALFGLGDADGYSGEFVNALGTLYEAVKARGANVVGAWPTDGYEFDESKAIVGGKFVGLVIDQDNQEDLTEERINTWVAQIKPEFE